MTIGMLVESMAGKSAALHGAAHDATPFTFSEEEPAWKYFGEQLRAAGYDYHGTERMYSGVTGTEFDADIFIGVSHRIYNAMCIQGALELHTCPYSFSSDLRGEGFGVGL